MDDRRLKEKLSGRVRYPQDVSSKNLLHVMVLYSTEIRADLLGFELPELPQDVFFITSKDIPGKNWLDFGDGGMPLLAEKEISYKGQPLALIYGPRLDELEGFIDKIIVKTETLPPLSDLDIQESKAISYERRIQEGNSEGIFQKDENNVLEDFFETTEQWHFSFPAPYSSCQKEGPRYIIHSITQWPWMVQKNVCSTLKLRKDQVQIKTYPCENSQDSKLFIPIQTSCIVALACFLSKKTTTLTPYPTDGLFLSRGRGSIQYYLKAATNTQGDLLALKIDFSFDSGAWPIWEKEWIDKICFASTASYHCRNVEIHGKSQPTNNPPTGQFPDSALSSVFSMIELLMNSLALQCKGDILQWKKKNILRKGNGFFTGALLTKEPGLDKLIDEVVERSDFKRKHSSYQYQSGRDSHHSLGIGSRGIGLSTAYLPSGFLTNNSDLYGAAVSLKLNQEGQLSISLPFQPGHKQLYKYWALTASEMLNIDQKQIQFLINNQPLLAGPGTLGRNITVINQLILNGLQWINKRRFRDPLPLEVTRRYRKKTAKWNDSGFTGNPFQFLSWGAMTVELMTDEETGYIDIKQIHIALDTGPLMIPSLASSVVERGLRQAHNWLTGSFQIPRVNFPGFKDRIPFNVFWQRSQSQPRSLDGLVQILYPAAFLQALSQATGQSQHNIPPLSQERSNL